MADNYPYRRDRHDHDDRDRLDRYGRDRYGRDDRGPLDRGGDEVRSWFGDEDAARRRRMDEQERERWERDAPPRTAGAEDDRWRSRSAWGQERSYSSDRPYGDPGYGWRDDRGDAGPGREHGYGTSSMAERDYGGHTWRTPSAPPRYSGSMEYGRQTYGGPYARERYGAREWSSTEGWRVPGPHAGRGPRGYQRSDERIREELYERLTAHGLIDASDIECRVTNGEVTLEGFVDSRAAKRAAEDVAEDLYGVREVHNQLRVRSHAGDEGVGRTSVLGLTETQAQTTHSPQTPESGRPRTRT